MHDDVGKLEYGVPQTECGLHQFLGYPSGKLLRKIRKTLSQEITVHPVAHAHREIDSYGLIKKESMQGNAGRKQNQGHGTEQNEHAPVFGKDGSGFSF